MKGILIAVSTTLSLGLLGGLSFMVKQDFNNGNIPIERAYINDDGLTLSYDEYNFDKRKLHSIYSNIFTAKEIENKKPVYLFENSFNENKEVYTVRGDSIAITYQFNEKDKKEKEQFNSLKKDIYKQKISKLKREDVAKIYLNRTSNIMQTSYIIEFKEPKNINELYQYSSKFVENNNESKLEAEFIKNNNELVNLYDSNSKYKRLNLSFSFSGNKAVVRNLVSEKQDNNKVNQTYKLIFKNKK